jgi:hypothetical protein
MGFLNKKASGVMYNNKSHNIPKTNICIIAFNYFV